MTKTMRHVQVWALVAAMSGMTAAVSAQQAPQTAGTPQQGLPIDRYVVGQANPPDMAGSQLMDLTLEQAMQTALDKNLDLQVARINPLIQDYNLESARAAFNPTLTASFNQNRSASVTNNALDGVSTNLTNQRRPTTGAQPDAAVVRQQFGVTFNNNRGASNSLNNRAIRAIKLDPRELLHAAARQFQDRQPAQQVADLSSNGRSRICSS